MKTLYFYVLDHYKKRGFTLIEVLVVVLIIGILSAIALPQYTKAVAKSRATQGLVMLKSIASAYHTYYMANGEWDSSLDDLDIQIPWNGSTAWKIGLKDTRSTRDWSVQLQWIVYNSKLLPVLYIGRLTGDYQGTGFAYFFGQWDNRPDGWGAAPDIIYCVEQVRGDGIIFPQTAGNFCQKVMGATQMIQSGDTVNYYKMP